MNLNLYLNFEENKIKIGEKIPFNQHWFDGSLYFSKKKRIKKYDRKNKFIFENSICEN